MKSKIKRPFFSFKKVPFEELYQTYKDEKGACDKEGNTLAHLAVIYNKCEYLKEFQELNDQENIYGFTPKMIAAHLGRPLESPKVTSKLFVRRKNKTEPEEFSEQETKKYFGIEYLDHLEFKNYSYLNYVCKHVKKALSKTDLKWKNHWTCCMHESQLIDKTFPLTYVKWIDALIGYGLFAGENIPQYAFIGEYTGVVRKRRAKTDKFNDYIFGYVVAINDTPFVIDAKERGNYTRFINHCDEPNLFSTWMISKGICHVILFAKQAIAKDAQLTYDYGPNFWKKRSDPLLLN